jgi:hypothetical protein
MRLTLRSARFLPALLLGGVLAPAAAAAAPPSLPDIRLWDRSLQRHVEGGRVNYESWKANRKDLDRYLAQAARSNPFSLPEGDEKKAFWINYYNACTIALVLDHHPLKSLRDLDKLAPPDPKTNKPGTVFDLPVCEVNHRKLSLNEIENRHLRWVKDNPDVADPRIHFALVCASSSCPFLQNRAFTGAQLHKRLEEASRRFFSDRRNFKIDDAKKQIRFSRLLHPEWLGKDFTGTAAQKSLQDAISKWLSAEDAARVRALLAQGYTIDFFEYDWSLNGR